MLFNSSDSSLAFSCAALAILAASAVKLLSVSSFWADSDAPGEASNLEAMASSSSLIFIWNRRTASFPSSRSSSPLSKPTCADPTRPLLLLAFFACRTALLRYWYLSLTKCKKLSVTFYKSWDNFIPKFYSIEGMAVLEESLVLAGAIQVHLYR